jgi:hypothetical protein
MTTKHITAGAHLAPGTHVGFYGRYQGKADIGRAAEMVENDQLRHCSAFA